MPFRGPSPDRIDHRPNRVADAGRMVAVQPIHCVIDRLDDVDPRSRERSVPRAC
jgi:hypothetical protein